MTEWTIVPINEGSFHLRLIYKKDKFKKFPPYINHTILENYSNGLGEFKGLSSKITPIEYREVFKIAKAKGFRKIRITRIKDDKPIYKFYTLR